jgi:hypothetical protein
MAGRNVANRVPPGLRLGRRRQTAPSNQAACAGGGDGLAVVGADAGADQQPAAQAAEGPGHEPVQLNPPRHRRHRRGAQAALRLVFGEVVQVGLLEQVQQGPREDRVARPPVRQADTDLKVDQVGLAVVANEDVLALVQVHVSQAAAVHLGQQSPQAEEELLADALALAQRVAGDVVVGDGVIEPPAAREHLAAPVRHVGQVRQPAQHALLAPGQQVPQPGSRHAENRLHAVELADDPLARSAVEGGGRPGIVLEDVEPAVRLARHPHDLGRVLGAQGAEKRRPGPRGPGGPSGLNRSCDRDRGGRLWGLHVVLPHAAWLEGGSTGPWVS